MTAVIGDLNILMRWLVRPRLMMGSRGIAVRHTNSDLHIICNAMHHNKKMQRNAQSTVQYDPTEAQ